MEKRESFQSRWGFILACIGSAVGMGNIWMFPTRVSLYGGGAFLIPYIYFCGVDRIYRCHRRDEFRAGNQVWSDRCIWNCL